MTPQDQELRKLYQSIQEMEVWPGHEYYVRIWEDSPYDPVRHLRTHIEWAEGASLQLFSGFTGSGKSTQLRRLKQELEKAGYFVIYAKAEDYLNLGEPVAITDLLLVIAGAFSDGLKLDDIDLVAESYWTRLLNYLQKTNIEVTEVGVTWGVTEFKAALKETPSFRQRLQSALAGRLSDVSRDVQRFVEEGVKALHGRNIKEIVFLFDSLEKNRGTPSNAQEIMDSLEGLFRSHLEMLKLPYVHCIYAVPAWLKFIRPDAKMVLIPSVRQWNKDLSRTPHAEGWDVLRRVIRTRFGEQGCSLLFGLPNSSGHHAEAERLIAECGGSLRDLLLLFRTALLEVRTVPLAAEDVTRAIGSVRNDFKTNIEDAHWLKKIGIERAADPETGDKRDLHRLMRLLETHFILYFKNDNDWYDIHPLVRDEVERIVRLNPRARE